MKKILMAVLFVFMFAGSAMAVDIIVTIPNDKLATITASFVKVHGQRLEYDKATENPNSFSKRVIKDLVDSTHEAAKVMEYEAGRQQAIDEANADTSGVNVN